MVNENINIEKVAGFWSETSDDDYQTMENLFKSKDFHWALFIGHLVLEKILKSYVVKKTLNNAPFTHNLSKLAILTGLNFSEEQLDMLDTITTFNLNARYDSYKKAFYKKCTFEFTNQWINHIKNLRSWIKQQHIN